MALRRTAWWAAMLLVSAGCAAGPAPLTVGLVLTPAGLGDRSVNDAAADGLRACAAATGVATKIVPTRAGQADRGSMQLAATGASEIITLGPAASAEVTALAPHEPAVHFTVIDAAAAGANVAAVAFRTREGAYLAGALAALASRTGVVGFLGGAAVPRVTDDLGAFRAGAAAVRPGVRVAVNLAASFDDPARARAAAEGLATSGAGVIFILAGPAGTAAIPAVAAHTTSDVIGVDSDQNALAPGRVVGSVVVRTGVAVELACRDAAARKPLSGTLRLGLAEGAIALTLARSAAVTPVIRRRLAALEHQVEAGTLRP